MLDGVMVNGEPVRLAFDTGSDAPVLFRPVAERLGLKITEPPADAKISAGQIRVGRTEAVQLQFGTRNGAKIVTDRLAVVDMPGGLRPDVDGVIGWGSLRDNFFVFDVSSSKVSIDATGQPPEPAGAWQRVGLRKGSRLLVLDFSGESGRIAGSVLIDTGSSAGVHLSAERWREWRTAHPDAPTTMDAYVMPGVGLVVREMSWVRELSIGPLNLTDVTVQEASSAEAAMASGYEATLGVAALKRQDVVIDGKNGVAYFARRQAPSPPLAHNRLGAVFTPSDLQHDPLEAHVATGSPAEAAGIRNGDVLLTIDAIDVTKWRTDSAGMAMGTFWQRPAGTKFLLTFRRGDREFAITVTLRDILGPGLPKRFETNTTPAPKAAQ